MHSKLLTSFGVIALLGVSVASYASWIKYVEGDGKVPNGDCLEMICVNGCVEEGGTFYGYCCPGAGRVGDSCRVDSGEDVDECCGEGLICAKEGPNKGKCVECLTDESCKKCVNNRWQNVVAGSWVNNNYCTRCDGKGGMYNIPKGEWGDNNPCTRCDGNGGTYNLPKGEWGDSNACTRCDGKGNMYNLVYGEWGDSNPCQKCDGNGGTYNLPKGEWGDNNPCTRCNGNGGSYNEPDGSNVQSDGKCCANGQLASCPTPTSTCTFGDKNYNDKDTVGDCGICDNGTLVRNSVVAQDCYGCNTSTWKWDPITDYNNKDADKKCCINGERKNDDTHCPVKCKTNDDCPICQTCCNLKNDINYEHCIYGAEKNGELHGDRVCDNSGSHYGIRDCWKKEGNSYKNMITGETRGGTFQYFPNPPADHYICYFPSG